MNFLILLSSVFTAMVALITFMSSPTLSVDMPSIIYVHKSWKTTRDRQVESARSFAGSRRFVAHISEDPLLVATIIIVCCY